MRWENVNSPKDWRGEMPGPHTRQRPGTIIDIMKLGSGFSPPGKTARKSQNVVLLFLNKQINKNAVRSSCWSHWIIPGNVAAR